MTSQGVVSRKLVLKTHLPVMTLARGGRGTRCQVPLSTSALYSSAIAARQFASASAVRVLADNGDAELVAVKPYRCIGGGREPVWERVSRTGGAEDAGAAGNMTSGSGAGGASGGGCEDEVGGGRLL
jgi:hypothetical protein